MSFPLILCLVLFPVIILGLGWPLAGQLTLDPAEKLCASALLSTVGVYFLAFAIYLLHLPLGSFWVLPVLAVAGLVGGRQTLAEVLRNPAARAMLAGQLILTGWCVGWLSAVVSYSGAGWTGDWIEHWQRTRFFLEHQPIDTKFLTYYPLPARPPLANLVTGATLGLTAPSFSGFQLVSSQLNCLVFLPAALLARRFQSGGPTCDGRAAIATVTVLLMLNPSFMENSTGAWTKLIAAFFVLGGLYFFLRAHDPAPDRAAAPVAAVALAAGLLAHFSAGPYLVMLGAGWFGLNRYRWSDTAFWQLTARLSLVGGAILATWFGWSAAVYGVKLTLFSNTSADPAPGSPILRIALNLRDTLVPHFLRNVYPSSITQSNPWGYWRDWLFLLYQVNLLFIFGSMAWVVLLRELARAAPQFPARQRWFWAAFLSGVIFLGVAVVGNRDAWGLAHICLQSLVVLGLAFLASRWTQLGRGWRLTLIAGATVDFCLGVLLQFGVQNFAFDRWLTPGRPPADTLAGYSSTTRINLIVKVNSRLDFFGDQINVPGSLVLALLAMILTLAVARAARRSA